MEKASVCGAMPPLSLDGSPILALEGNILWQFENLKNGSRERLVAEVNSGRL